MEFRRILDPSARGSVSGWHDHEGVQDLGSSNSVAVLIDDRFLQCVAWVEGPDSKPFPHRLKKCAASETFVCLRSGL